MSMAYLSYVAIRVRQISLVLWLFLSWDETGISSKQFQYETSNVRQPYDFTNATRTNDSINIQGVYDSSIGHRMYQTRKCKILCDSLIDCPCMAFMEGEPICSLTKNIFKNNKVDNEKKFKDHSANLCHQRTMLLFTRLQREKCVNITSNIENKERETGSASSKTIKITSVGRGETLKRDISTRGDVKRKNACLQEPSRSKYRHASEFITSNPLHQACRNGNLEVVRCILSHNLEDINCQGTYGRTPIMVAACKGYLDVFDYLVRQGCDLSLRDRNNATVLHVACYAGKTDIVRKLITELKHDVDLVDRFGMTPVMAAAVNGHREVIEFLVDKGCNVTVADININNILHVACCNGHIGIVEYILKRNLVNIDSRGIYGRTAVLMAAENGHKETVQLLIREGCNLTLADKYSNTIFHRVCSSDKVDIAKYLITQNIVHKDIKDRAGRTPLLIAACFGATRVFDSLVSAGCSLGAVDIDGNTILHVACLGGHIDMVKHIIKHYRVGIDSKGFSGRTSLLTTAGTANSAIFDFLVRKGCNVKVVDNYENNILHVACLGGHLVMVKHIIKNYDVDIESKGFQGRTPLLISVGTGHAAIFDFLLRKGCNVKAVDDDKCNILHVAILSGSIHMVKLIISQTKVSIRSKGYEGRTPLLIAANIGSESIFYLLERKGCNMKAVDDKSSNVLHLACDSGNVRLVRYIITKHLFDIDCLDAFGTTPVLRAAHFGHTEVVKFLKGEGCNMNAVDDNGNNIMHMACFSGKAYLVKFLIREQLESVHDRNKHGQTSLDVAKSLKYSELVDVINNRE